VRHRRLRVRSAAAGSSFVVTVTSDHDDGVCGPGDCSLREAINAANAHSGADTITFNIPPSDAGCDGVTHVCMITLGSALPQIGDDVTIEGSPQKITISGNDLYQVSRRRTTTRRSTSTTSPSRMAAAALTAPA